MLPGHALALSPFEPGLGLWEAGWEREQAEKEQQAAAGREEGERGGLGDVSESRAEGSGGLHGHAPVAETSGSGAAGAPSEGTPKRRRLRKVGSAVGAEPVIQEASSPAVVETRGREQGTPPGSGVEEIVMDTPPWRLRRKTPWGATASPTVGGPGPSVNLDEESAMDASRRRVRGQTAPASVASPAGSSVSGSRVVATVGRGSRLSDVVPGSTESGRDAVAQRSNHISWTTTTPG